MPGSDLHLPAPPAPFFFVGDALCLDLLNTVAQGRDLLPDFASYVRWLSQAGILSGEEAQAVIRRWGFNPEGTAALTAVKTLRQTLREAVEAVLAGRPVSAKVLEALNTLLARSPTRAELVSDAAGKLQKRFRLDWREPADLLAPVAESAADLLTNTDYGLIRRCANPACTLVFHDRTKNHHRRWCSMAVCGNRAKVTAHRARQKGGGRAS